MIVEVKSPGTVFTGEGSLVSLTCEIYGYPHNSCSPVWTRGSEKLQGDKYTTTVINAGLLNVSSTERVVSQLTIRNVTEDDSGEYTCSVEGNSTTANLTVVLEGNIDLHFMLCVVSISVMNICLCFFGVFCVLLVSVLILYFVVYFCLLPLALLNIIVAVLCYLFFVISVDVLASCEQYSM